MDENKYWKEDESYIYTYLLLVLYISYREIREKKMIYFIN